MRDYSTSIAAVLRAGSTRFDAAGTGIVLDRRRVLTCAHVVNEALDRDGMCPQLPDGKSLPVEIPLRRCGDERFEMRVVSRLWRAPTEDPQYGKAEDLAVLELVGGTFPEAVAAARLIKVDLSNEHNWPVWLTGFPSGRAGDRVPGVINGLDGLGRISIDPMHGGRAVAGGFSGGAIWHEQRNGVLGMLVAKRERVGQTIASGIPVDVLADELGLPVEPADVATNVADAIGNPPTDAASWRTLLDRFPIGPALDWHRLPPDLVRWAADAVEPRAARPLVLGAGGPVMTTLPPEKASRRHLYIVSQGDLPDPAVVGSVTFWTEAFSIACVKGPRMLAALVFILPEATWLGRESTIVDLLKLLMKWKG